MSVFRRCGLVMLAGVLLVGAAACSDSRQRNAANVGGTWACDDGEKGLLYQVAKNQDGSASLYTYVRESEGQWGDNLVAEITNLQNGQVLNALTLTPQGVMYAVLSPDGGSSSFDDLLLMRIDPPTGDSGAQISLVSAFPPEANPSKSVNSGTYIEINGVPHLAMANNTKPAMLCCARTSAFQKCRNRNHVSRMAA